MAPGMSRLHCGPKPKSIELRKLAMMAAMGLSTQYSSRHGLEVMKLATKWWCCSTDKDLSTVMSINSGMAMGTICCRSLMVTMTDDTKKTSPKVNGISTRRYSGLHKMASRGAYVKPAIRMASGMMAMSDENADSSTC